MHLKAAEGPGRFGPIVESRFFAESSRMPQLQRVRPAASLAMNHSNPGGVTRNNIGNAPGLEKRAYGAHLYRTRYYPLTYSQVCLEPELALGEEGEGG